MLRQEGLSLSVKGWPPSFRGEALGTVVSPTVTSSSSSHGAPIHRRHVLEQLRAASIDHTVAALQHELPDAACAAAGSAVPHRFGSAG